MLRTSFSDPGIIPRNLDAENPWDTNVAPSLATNPSNNSYPPRKFAMVNGIEVMLKYCDTCKIYRPPRASHCRQCDNCIESVDHHCIWLNNCVGRQNYRYFFLFLISVFSICLYICILSISHLVWVYSERTEFGESFLDVLRQIPVSMALSIYTFVFTWSIGSLLAFHCYLVSKNMTTHEKLRSGSRGVNPFDKGNIFYNCFDILCRSPPAPHLRWRSRDPSQLHYLQPDLSQAPARTF